MPIASNYSLTKNASRLHRFCANEAALHQKFDEHVSARPNECLPCQKDSGVTALLRTGPCVIQQGQLPRAKLAPRPAPKKTDSLLLLTQGHRRRRAAHAQRGVETGQER